MLNAFYIFVAVCTVFVIISLQVVRAHEKKMAAVAMAISAAEQAGTEAPVVLPEEEFFTSPIYKAMEFIAHM